MSYAEIFLWPVAAMLWSAGLTALGVLGARFRAGALGLVPLALASWFALDAIVIDPFDIAQTYVPLVVALAVVVTIVGAVCHALGRVLRGRLAP